jgi:hypothetical protein
VGGWADRQVGYVYRRTPPRLLTCAAISGYARPLVLYPLDADGRSAPELRYVCTAACCQLGMGQYEENPPDERPTAVSEPGKGKPGAGVVPPTAVT